MKGNVRQFYASASVRELERRAMASGIPGYALMQRAAAAAWRELLWRWPRAQRIAVVCGPGNNGGDGYELAALARAAGCEVSVFQVGKPGDREEARAARKAWGKPASELRPLVGFDVIVDAIFGIGLSRAPERAVADAIGAINTAREHGAGVLAIDVPSGLDADRGSAPGAVVTADLTASFIGAKPGLHTGAGPDHAGAVVYDDLSLELGILDGVAAIEAASLDDVQALPVRRATAHKGDHGHVLLVGGDHGMGGALLLAARAAQRAGAGLLSLATRPEFAAALTAAQPELMCHALGNPSGLRALLPHANVVALGPGLGRNQWGGEVFSHALSTKLPMVVDADGLNWLAENPEARDNWVLTPHPGEAARMLGVTTREIQADRFTAARKLHERYGGVIVLKGAGTLVQGESLALCPHGNAGMGVGGMGDVLCGLIAGLIAQGASLELAARAGVAAHALAGDVLAARALRKGMTPSDLIETLPLVLNA